MMRKWIANRMRRHAGASPASPSPPRPGELPASWQPFQNYVSVHPAALIAPSAALQIFNPPDPPRVCVEIGEGSHIFSTFSILRPQATIRVGRNCQLGASQFIAADSVEIDDDVIMAWNCTVIDSDNHAVHWSDRKNDVARCRDAWISTGGRDIGRLHDWSQVAMGRVHIGAKAWIGLGCTILKGVQIGEGAVVGAASVVTRSLPPWTLAAGVPCRPIRPLDPVRI
jgi:acetyltransferase-like isoleucine patch superfamily enzyme